MEPGPITADVTAILVRGLSIWLSAIFVVLCGAGVAAYACLLWQVCAPGQARGDPAGTHATLTTGPCFLKGGLNAGNTLDS